MLLPSALGAQGNGGYAGFWKKNCDDPYGLQIKPVSKGVYAIAFCRSDSCSAPGSYRPNSRIDNDPMYEVLGERRIKVRDGDGGFSTYVKCTSELLPPLTGK